MEQITHEKIGAIVRDSHTQIEVWGTSRARALIPQTRQTTIGYLDSICSGSREQWRLPHFQFTLLIKVYYELYGICVFFFK